MGVVQGTEDAEMKAYLAGWWAGAREGDDPYVFPEVSWSRYAMTRDERGDD